MSVDSVHASAMAIDGLSIFLILIAIKIIIQSLNFRGIDTIQSRSNCGRNSVEFWLPMIAVLMAEIGLDFDRIQSDIESNQTVVGFRQDVEFDHTTADF